MELSEKCLDSEFWHACAGGMVQKLRVNSKVFYFPQGHAEHTLTAVDFSGLPKIPPLILCRVEAVKYMADLESDEVYARIKLVPIASDAGYDEDEDDDGVSGRNGSETAEKSNFFAKTLTQSDANNGGGFSVPRYCAETIFPPLDYAADPPVQTLTVKDVHGVTWKFRHIYRGTPRRHLLTTGWSTFVNHKKLVAGDSIVFLRSAIGEIFVGIRRVKRASYSSSDTTSSWISMAGKYGAFSSFLSEDDNKMKRSSGNDGSPSSSIGGFRGKGRVNPQSVLEAAYHAASGNPFEVAYYPLTSTPDFCVKASYVSSAMRIQWCPKMRFKMAFETEDSSRISWFLGTIDSVQVTDPIQWPNSPWRLLQVAWDEPELLQNVKHVSPWMVELVAAMPIIHLSPFSPPRKKLCLPQDFSLDGQVQLPSFSTNAPGASSTFCCSSDNLSAGIQEARHMQSDRPLMDPHLNNKLYLGLSPLSLTLQNNNINTKDQEDCSENISCSLTPGKSTTHNVMTPQFVLFGQPILTEQQLSHRSQKNPKEKVPAKAERFPYNNKNNIKHKRFQEKVLGAGATHFGNQTLHPDKLSIDYGGQCKVFLGAETAARYIDLSILDSYEELYKKLANMYGISCSLILNRVIYCDSTGAVKQVGDDLFSQFKKKAERLTILVNPNSSSQRRQTDGFPTTQSGLDSSNQAGFLGISA